MTNPNGRFGIHGGQYIPETLMNAVIELEEAYNHYKDDPEFNRELTGTVSAQTVVLTAPTSRMKDEDIQTLVQIRDTIQSVLQFVQSTADSMQKAG